MINLTRRSALFVCSTAWFLVGLVLFVRGIIFLMRATFPDVLGGKAAVLPYVAPHVGGMETAALLWLALFMVIGLMKGRFLLARAAQRVIMRIMRLETPIRLLQIFDRRMLILILIMMGFGLTLTLIGCPQDIRGGIDCAVGAALFTGSFVYLRVAFQTAKS